MRDHVNKTDITHKRRFYQRSLLSLMAVTFCWFPAGQAWVDPINSRYSGPSCPGLATSRRRMRPSRIWMGGNNGDATNAFHTIRSQDTYHALPRLYIRTTAISTKWAENVHVALTPEQAHYVTKVMRIGTKKSRNAIRIFDGIHGEWLAELTTSPTSESSQSGRSRRRAGSDDMVWARCQQQIRTQDTLYSSNHCLATEPWLFFAPIKKVRVKLMLEKCTELGVGKFIPIFTDRTDPASMRDFTDTSSIKKLATQTVEASEQCERLTVPPLCTNCLIDESSNGNDGEKQEQPWSLSELLTNWATEDALLTRHLLICRERSSCGCASLLEVLGTLPSAHVAFLIGPEGGWSPEEEAQIDRCCQDSDRILGVSLGPSVLRAETAAMGAVSAFMLYQDSLT